MKKYVLMLALSFLMLSLIVPSATATVRKIGSQGDYFPMSNFLLEIDGVIQAGFKEISGLKSETEIFEYKDNNDDDDDTTPVRRRPGPTRYSSLVLERGFINDSALLEWYQRTTEGVTERKSGSVIVLDRAGQESMRYQLFEAWPYRLEGPILNDKGYSRMIEELELAFEKIEIQADHYSPLTFHFADGDVPAFIDAASVNVLFDPPGLPWKHHDIQGLDAPTLEFTSGEPYRLEMDLFFDRYEEGKSVREYTDKIEKLAFAGTEQEGKSSECIVTWGDKKFRCIVEQAQTSYTLFSEDGIPLRAVMNVVFKEFSPAVDQLKGKPRH